MFNAVQVVQKALKNIDELISDFQRRIGGLEIANFLNISSFVVQRRIGGLEKFPITASTVLIVQRRIGGLEN